MSEEKVIVDVIKDNVFHKRVTDVRRATQSNIDARAVVDYLQSSQQNAGSNGADVSRVSGTFPTTGGFVQPQPPNYSQSGVFKRHDVVVREMSEDEIDQKAFYDSNTEAYNLRYTLRALQNEMLRSQTFNRPVTIMVVIINKLKDLGLDYGALALDAINIAAANTLISSLRGVDIIGRFMEDRFIVICPETDINTAAGLAERVRLKFESIAIPHQWHTIRFQANIGLAHFPAQGTDVESLVCLADFAADQVSERGGNTILLAPNV